MTTQPLTPAGLRCAHKVNPLGVAPDRVRLSWVLEGAGTGRAQRAYQVLATPDDCRPNSGDDLCWDSGRIESSASADIAYAGLPLAAGGRYLWKVRIWDGNGRPSESAFHSRPLREPYVSGEFEKTNSKFRFKFSNSNPLLH